MGDFILSCCSAVDLTAEQMEELGISYVPFHYELGGTDYVDDLGVTVPYDEFYRRMVAGEDTKTSQVNVEEFVNYFEKYLKEGKDVLHLTLSSGISGTLNSAKLAKDMLEEKYPDRRLYIVDSLAASGGYGLLMWELAEMKNSGKDIDEVYDLPMWDGDRIFMPLLQTHEPAFEMSLGYDGDKLLDVIGPVYPAKKKGKKHGRKKR